METALLFYFYTQKRNSPLFSSHGPCSWLCKCLGPSLNERWPAALLSASDLVEEACIWLPAVCPAVPCHYLRTDFGLLPEPSLHLVYLGEWATLSRKANASVRFSCPSQCFYLYLFSRAWPSALLSVSFAMSLSNKQYLIGALINRFTPLCAQVNIVGSLPPSHKQVPPPPTP